VNNCPLLWTDGTTLGTETYNTLTSMGVTDVYLIDYPDAVASGVLDELSAMSISVTEFSGPGDLLPASLNLTGQSVACVYKDEMQSLPAALAAARYGGYALQLPESLDQLNMQAMADLRSYLPMGNTKLDAPISGAKAYGSAVLAAEFYTFLESVGGSDPLHLEYVLTFSDQTIIPDFLQYTPMLVNQNFWTKFTLAGSNGTISVCPSTTSRNSARISTGPGIAVDGSEP
jgi:hypothetical protein